MAKLTQNLSASPDVSPVRTVVLQPTPFCNINCRYCYLPQRSDTTVMPLATIVAAFEKILASGWASPQMTIIWHAGEPLVLPVSYYQQAFEAIEALRPQSLQLRHSIQTNGMLLTPEWCDLIRKWQIGMGVSIDGPRRLHDANRVTRSGAGTFDRTIAGIRLLRKEKIPFHVISVLSEAAMNSPEELLDFYLAEGIEDVCFNVEESEGDHISSLLATNNPRERFRRFLDRFWTLSRQSLRIHFIREIDGMITRIFRPEGVPLNNEQVEPFGMLNIDCHGNVCSFSPELLGYKSKAYNDFIIGNVLTNSLEEMRQSAAMQAMTRDIAAGVEKCRKECEYFSVCGGGAPVNKLSENGSFASSKTSFCSLVYMAPTDLILSALDRLEHDVDSAPAQMRLPCSPVPIAPSSSQETGSRDAHWSPAPIEAVSIGYSQARTTVSARYAMIKSVSVAVLSIFLGISTFAQTSSGAAPKAKPASPATESTSSGEGSAEPQPQEVSPSFVPVLWVSSVETLSTTHGPQVDFIRVRGVTSTEGWQSGELIPITKGPALDGILDLIFVADPPFDSTTPGPFPGIEAVFTMEPGHPYKGVRVHSATNRITLKSIPGYAEAPPPPEDCSKCVGKYLVAKGGTAPAGINPADIIHEQNLPKRAHVIHEDDGIGKLDSDPNRMTLVLGEDGRILIAVWD